MTQAEVEIAPEAANAAQEPAPVVAEELAAPATVQPEPPVATEPIAVPAAVPANLSETLEASGLVLVETASDKIRPVVVAEPVPVQPRRRKPAVVVSDEPMVMVETNK